MAIIKRLIFKHWQAKLASLALAILVWSIVKKTLTPYYPPSVLDNPAGSLEAFLLPEWRPVVEMTDSSHWTGSAG